MLIFWPPNLVDQTTPPASALPADIMPPKKRKAPVSDDGEDFDELKPDTDEENFVPGELIQPTNGYLSAVDLYSKLHLHSSTRRAHAMLNVL